MNFVSEKSEVAVRLTSSILHNYDFTWTDADDWQVIESKLMIFLENQVTKFCHLIGPCYRDLWPLIIGRQSPTDSPIRDSFVSGLESSSFPKKSIMG